MKKEALRVTSTLPVTPTTLYFAWIDSDHHSSMTGMTAKIDPTVGAKYSMCNGYVTGKLVILDLGRRIVMSWRTTDFPRDAADSRVEVHFETLGTNTRLLILHTDIPEGQSERYKTLWNDKYVTPMRTYFSKFLPDPRNPPVRRPPPPPPESDDEEDEEEEPVAKGRLLGKRFGAKAAPAPLKGAPAGKAALGKTAPGPGVHKVEAKATKAPVAKAPAAKTQVVKGAAKKAAKPAKPAKPSKPAKKAVPKKATPKPAAKKPAKPAKKPAPKPAKKKKR